MREGSAGASRAPARWRAVPRPRPAVGAAARDPQLAARRRTAIVVGLLTLLAVTGLLVGIVVVADGGFTYVLDDPYIHLSMARNLAQHATYGLVPGVYVSASSSPAWVALLASLLKVAPGTAEWLPLVLNVLAGGAVLVLVLRSQSCLYAIPSPVLRGVLYVLLPIALFLPALALVGMEHSLQALLVVSRILLLARACQRRLSRGELATVAALSLVAGAVRYESVFLSAGAALALMLAPGFGGVAARLRRPELWAFVLPPLASIGVLGAVNVAHGGMLLPNSVVAKSALAGGGGVGELVPSLAVSAGNLVEDVQLAVLVGVALLYLVVRGRRGAQSGAWIAFVVASLLQVAYARTGSFDRYQAALVICGTLLALRSATEVDVRRGARQLLIAALVLGALPLGKFGLEAHVPQSARHIHDEQETLARFLEAAYADRTVMVNDIGEVSWVHRGRLDDLWALGSDSVLRAYQQHDMGRPFVEALATRDRVPVAAVFDFFSSVIPGDWVRVAQWSVRGTTPPDVSVPVDFYAPTAADAARLRRAMQAFLPHVPSDVEVRWGGSAS